MIKHPLSHLNWKQMGCRLPPSCPRVDEKRAVLSALRSWRQQPRHYSYSEGSFISVYQITHRSCQWLQIPGALNVHIKKILAPLAQTDVSFQMSWHQSVKREATFVVTDKPTDWCPLTKAENLLDPHPETWCSLFLILSTVHPSHSPSDHMNHNSGQWDDPKDTSRRNLWKLYIEVKHWQQLGGGIGRKTIPVRPQPSPRIPVTH